MLKIGFTNRDVEKRVREQFPVVKPGGLPFRIVFERTAMRPDGSTFRDFEIHQRLIANGITKVAGEWFKCNLEDLDSAYIEVFNRQFNEGSHNLDFELRPEQREVIHRTATYFQQCTERDETPPYRFLWNAKMRFGKTFAAYKLAEKLNWKKILILTFKPAAQNAWEFDLNCHIDFRGWQFITRSNMAFEDADKSKPIVCFGSFQDFLGKNRSTGGIKPKNEWVHCTNWDCVIFDEYHYGAWKDRVKELFESEESDEKRVSSGQDYSLCDEEILPITSGHFLYLSGTPFRALATGEFIEEQIFNWTYLDEQRAKAEWVGEDNPYKSLPRMVFLTYQLPNSVSEIASEGEFNEFDLNTFFSTTGAQGLAQFQFKNEVQKWLSWIRGALGESAVDDLVLGQKKPPLPFSDSRLLNVLNHTVWFLPTIDSCYAMQNLLEERQNVFYNDYKVLVVAGNAVGVGIDALEPVKKAMTDDPLTKKTITLSCGKLLTGVTISPWTGIFMLRNLSAPETYFQAAFRVQSPWTISNPDGVSPNKEEIIKQECYVFDFAPNRSIRQIADYSCALDPREAPLEKKVSDFINFLPVLAFDGNAMREIDAESILDIATSGTTATLLAKRWECALLVNVDNHTLQKLLKNTEALNALMQIEGFRTLNRQIETIINVTDKITNKKKNNTELSPSERTNLSTEEREMKKLRKEIRVKLIKFATRIPIFMYLTDYREQTLKDVITKLEPSLFRRVTGLTIPDFEVLVDLGLFNSSLMNDAVYKFKRYEDSSLGYTGLNKHAGMNIGLYDTVVRKESPNALEFFELVQE